MTLWPFLYVTAGGVRAIITEQNVSDDKDDAFVINVRLFSNYFITSDSDPGGSQRLGSLCRLPVIGWYVVADFGVISNVVT